MTSWKLRGGLLVGALATVACLSLLAAASTPTTATNDVPKQVPEGEPAATIDLGTAEGAAAVQGQWRYTPISLHEVQVPDRPDQGPAYLYEPRDAMQPDFDDSQWQVIDAATLGQPRGAGHICLCWYRITIAVPEQVGDFSTAGSTVVFDTIVDDYGEVWVNGELTSLEGPGTRYQVGQDGGSVVNGFNAPNRLIVARNVQPGDRITLAIFAINSPLSVAPGNYIFLRYARLQFYPAQ